MSDHHLGQQLRAQLLLDLDQGESGLPRRLQALVADLCGQAHAPLLAPLSFLVQTPVFLEALQRRPALPHDPQLAGMLQHCLHGVFPPAINARMQAVVRGLLDMPPLASPTPSPTPHAVVVAQPSSQRGVLALLSFIAGALLVGVGFGIPWLLRMSNQPTPALPTATPPAPPPATPPAPPPAVESPAPAPAPVAAPRATERGLDAFSTDRAISSVHALYRELSAGNYAAAAQHFAPAVADQFDPSFFAQFERVDVEGLEVVSRTGSRLDLRGMVTFVYPDGSSQLETRTYRVDIDNDPPLIIRSAFGRVIRPRR